MPICPAGERFGFDEYYARGKAEIAKSLLDGNLKWSTSLANVVYRCTMCRACAEQCVTAYKDHVMDIHKALREELVEHGLVPPEIRDFLENIYNHGNPWGEPRRRRGDWAEGTGIRQFQSGDEFLYYVGCTGSYDARGGDIARSLGEVLLRSGLSCGVLGRDENCDGNEVNLLGESGLFELLAEENIRRFKEMGVRKIVALSPHAYNVMKNEYPQHGGTFEVIHYTQLLHDIIDGGSLDISGFNARVTYHDPCFLGRYNEVFEEPRKILEAIPGVTLVEMPRNRENSFCCGGGAGNFYTDFFAGGENSPGRVRVREAYETGAEVLAVACPNCMTMLEDAVKVEGLEGRLTVRDISEILNDSCQKR